MSRIVITGAGSPVGRKVVERLLREPELEIEAWVSTSARHAVPASMARCTWRAVDLQQTLSVEAAAVIARCDTLLHLAWVRSPDASNAIAANTSMIRNLAQHMRDPSALRVVSSVSSGPRARSAYGRAKYAANQLAVEIGAAALLLGLIVEAHPKSGPFKMLAGFVRKLPVRIRFIDRDPNIYPVREGDAMELLTTFATGHELRGLFRGFSPPLGINRFLAAIEAAHPRSRVPLPMFATPLQAVAGFASRLQLPGSAILDKVATILYKDDDYLLSAPSLPGPEPARCEGAGYFM